MIYIKYDKKYQYPVSDVYTIAGKPYTEYYAERSEEWLRGRAVKNISDVGKLLEPLKYKLAKGKSDVLERVCQTKHGVDKRLEALERHSKNGGV